jgi:hypothetical protein
MRSLFIYRTLFMGTLLTLAACSVSVKTPQTGSWAEAEKQKVYQDCTESSELKAGLNDASFVAPICECFTKEVTTNFTPAQNANPDIAVEKAMESYLRSCAEASGQVVNFNALSAIRLMRQIDQERPGEGQPAVSKVLKNVKPVKPTPVTPKPAPPASHGPAPTASVPAPSARPVDPTVKIPLAIQDARKAQGMNNASHVVCSDNTNKNWLVYIELNRAVTGFTALELSKSVIYFKRGKYNPFNGNESFHRFVHEVSKGTKQDGTVSYTLDQEGGGAGAQLVLETKDHKVGRAFFAAPGEPKKTKLLCDFFSSEISQQQLLDEQYNFRKDPIEPEPETSYSNNGFKVDVKIRPRQ